MISIRISSSATHEHQGPETAKYGLETILKINIINLTKSYGSTLASETCKMPGTAEKTQKFN